MKIEKTRFCNLRIGDKFTWAGNPIEKTTERRGYSRQQNRDYIFSNTDVVLIEVEEQEDDSFDVWSLIGAQTKVASNGNGYLGSNVDDDV